MYADPIRKLQEQLYEQLIAIREGFHQTLTTAVAEVASAAPVASAPATAEDGEEPIVVKNAEVEQLKSQNKKLEYRIVHLLRAIEDLEAKQGAAASGL